MKKLYLFLFGLITLFSFDLSVKAEEILPDSDYVYTNSNQYVEYDYYYSNYRCVGYEDKIYEINSLLVDHYNENLSEDYPYYVTSFYCGTANIYGVLTPYGAYSPIALTSILDENNHLNVYLGLHFKDDPSMSSISGASDYLTPRGINRNVQYSIKYNKKEDIKYLDFKDYDLSNNEFFTNKYLVYNSTAYSVDKNDNDIITDYYDFNPYLLYDTNDRLSRVEFMYDDGSDYRHIYSEYVDFVYQVTGYFSQYSYFQNTYFGSIIDNNYPVSYNYSNWSPLLFRFRDLYESEFERYEEYNLNDYDFIVLSLKDYDNIDPFDVVISYKGSFCPTPVYSYGQKIKDNNFNRCSFSYDYYSSVKLYILSSDIENHAVYYLSSYDRTKENLVKIPLKYFRVHTITELDGALPSITINGSVYNIKHLDDIESSTNNNEENNIVPGESVGFDPVGNFWDTTFSDWSSILNFFKNAFVSLFSSISAIFNLVILFVSVLPPVMQSVIIVFFSSVFIIAIIKIIL